MAPKFDPINSNQCNFAPPYECQVYKACSLVNLCFLRPNNFHFVIRNGMFAMCEGTNVKTTIEAVCMLLRIEDIVSSIKKKQAPGAC